MRTVTLGPTGIVTPQNAFGALPIQRVSEEDAVALLRRAFEGGMTFFDTARAYSNSEERVGLAFEGMRGKVAIATKTQARTPEAFWEGPGNLASPFAHRSCGPVPVPLRGPVLQAR